MAFENTSRDSGASTILKIVLAIVEFLLVATVLILGLAFLMGLLGANPEAAFAAWIYERADSVMTPFEGVFDPIELTDGTAIHTSLLFAMLVYAAVAALIGGLAKRFN